jgi:hypothetical protein
MLPYNGGNTTDRNKKINGGVSIPLPDKITIETPKVDKEVDFLPGTGAQEHEETNVEQTPEPEEF